MPCFVPCSADVSWSEKDKLKELWDKKSTELQNYFPELTVGILMCTSQSATCGRWESKPAEGHNSACSGSEMKWNLTRYTDSLMLSPTGTTHQLIANRGKGLWKIREKKLVISHSKFKIASCDSHKVGKNLYCFMWNEWVGERSKWVGAGHFCWSRIETWTCHMLTAQESSVWVLLKPEWLLQCCIPLHISPLTHNKDRSFDIHQLHRRVPVLACQSLGHHHLIVFVYYRNSLQPYQSSLLSWLKNLC